jgi:hypothetical protein
MVTLCFPTVTRVPGGRVPAGAVRGGIEEGVESDAGFIMLDRAALEANGVAILLGGRRPVRFALRYEGRRSTVALSQVAYIRIPSQLGNRSPMVA